MSQAGITGVILAGGQARRMNGVDKGLIQLAGKPLLEHVLAVFAPQVAQLAISVNRNFEHYATYGFPLVQDLSDARQGPLAGMLSAMRIATTPYLLCVPCDAPLLPADLALRMKQSLEDKGARLCVAHDGAVMQPVFVLLECALADDIERYLMHGGRKVAEWINRQHYALADFSDSPDAFANLNTPQDRAWIEALLSGGRSC